MSPNQGSRWATWGTVSSGFCEIEIGWDRLGSVGLLAPFLAPAKNGLSRTATADGCEPVAEVILSALSYADLDDP